MISFFVLISALLLCGGLGLKVNTVMKSHFALKMKLHTNDQPVPISMPLSKRVWKSSAAVLGIITSSAFLNIPRATAESNFVLNNILQNSFN